MSAHPFGHECVLWHILDKGHKITGCPEGETFFLLLVCEGRASGLL